MGPQDRFYLSAPSGIDGNVWDGYEKFLTFLENKCPEMKLLLDLAYLNTTPETPVIRTESDDITASDVTFVATQPTPESPTPMQEFLQRGQHVRYCLTPGMIQALKDSQS